ncbi:MAG TPA: glycosyltransferase [Thermohalobaculum sp.]|nr:glycosyltransferase [Thermohalobaculum sp.]
MTGETSGKGRIAIVLPDLRGGGAERLNLILAREFLDRGFGVDLVLARVEGDLLDDVPDGCRIVDLAAPRLRWVFPALRRYLRSERPLGVLAAMWPLTGIACLAVRTARVPVRLVVSEHNDFRLAPAITSRERFLLRIFGGWIYRPADAVVAVSQGVAESLHRCAGLEAGKTRVIYNPLREPSGGPWPSEDLPLREWWNAGGKRLLTVGALKPQKAHDVLLQALAALDSHPDSRLIVLGEGPLRSETQALAERLGLAARVRLPGFRRDPFPFMSEADLFVLSSSWEGFGNVLIEAMACGTPVVSTDCPSGPSEILANGTYGVLVPPGDPAALASGVDAALCAPPRPELLKQRAREFSPARAATAFLTAMFGSPV